MAETQQKYKITVPRSFNATQRQQVGDLAIEVIQARTAKGISKSGKPFAKYSDSYKESKDFQLAGKTSKVNLELSSEMMGSIEILGSGPGHVTIGFEAGTEVNDKASWAATSTKAIHRPFLGLTVTETAQIITTVKSATTETQVRQLLKKAETEGTSPALSSFLQNILGRG